MKANRPKSSHVGRLPAKWALYVCLCVGGATLSGCMSTRGMMYLHPERSATYLAKENKPTGKTARGELVEQAVEKTRVLLREIPDGRRRLGGFCTETQLSNQLRAMMDKITSCRERLQKYQNKSNVYGIVFWSLLGATAATGLAGVIGAAAATDGGLKGGLLLGFGIPMLTFALANAIGPFARIQHRNYAKGTKLDNYMWTLRRRVSVEVCTARDRATAYHRLYRIEKRLNELCVSTRPDDGIYALPE